MGNNGNGKVPALATQDPKTILEAMVKFMDNSNEIMSDLAVKLANQQIDIDKLKKHIINKNRIIIN